MTITHVTGDFFLAMPASRCLSREGEAGVIFRVREPAPATTFPDGLLAAWLGPAAVAFADAHTLDLKPGRGLRLSLHHLRAREGELRARVQACELLPPPPNWRKPEPSPIPSTGREAATTSESEKA